MRCGVVYLPLVTVIGAIFRHVYCSAKSRKMSYVQHHCCLLSFIVNDMQFMFIIPFPNTDAKKCKEVEYDNNMLCCNTEKSVAQ